MLQLVCLTQFTAVHALLVCALQGPCHALHRCSACCPTAHLPTQQLPNSLTIPLLQQARLPGADGTPGAAAAQSARRVQPLRKSSSSGGEQGISPPPRAESVDEAQ